MYRLLELIPWILGVCGIILIFVLGFVAWWALGFIGPPKKGARIQWSKAQVITFTGVLVVALSAIGYVIYINI